MSGSRVSVVAWLLTISAPAPVLPQQARVAHEAAGVGQASRQEAPLPVVARHRYRMKGRIRPLLFFWIGRDNVGGAQVVWRRDDQGAEGFELLIGSDPDRAPRRINRWGYVAEEIRGSSARLLGVMKQSNEESIKEAKARMAQDAETGKYVFKAIRSTATADAAESSTTTVRSSLDFTYRDLGALLERVSASTETNTHQIELPEGTQPGFLVALAAIVHQSVAAYQELGAEARKRPKATSVYVFNGKLYDLKVRGMKIIRQAHYDDRPYHDLIQTEFETRNRTTGKKNRFKLVYGTEGDLAEVPVHIVYRPRWWFEAELVLDDETEF